MRLYRLIAVQSCHFTTPLKLLNEIVKRVLKVGKARYTDVLPHIVLHPVVNTALDNLFLQLELLPRIRV
jgi:hypothetical protein